MHLSRWDNLFWLTCFGGNVGLLWILIDRRRWQAFPWFTMLISGEIVQSTYLFFVHEFGSKTRYFNSYWSFELFEGLIKFLVICELSKAIIKHFYGETDGVSRDFVLSFVTLLTTGALIAWRAAPQSAMRHAFEVSIVDTVLIAGSSLIPIVWNWYYRVPHRAHSMIIAYGLSAFAWAQLLVICAATLAPHYWGTLERGLKPLYAVCLLTWCIFLWRDEPEKPQGRSGADSRLSQKKERPSNKVRPCVPLSQGQRAFKEV